MKFDIVTPSFNQVTYLPETLKSVLSQEGPDVDVSYYIMDGGSTDGSVDFIRSHESDLAFWRSEKDEGQSAAIKEGLAMGDGEIIAWINSDDFYPSGVFKKVAEYFSKHPEVAVIYGDCLHFLCACRCTIRSARCRQTDSSGGTGVATGT